MKKFLSLLLVFIMLFTLVACGKDNNQVNNNENIANNENVSGTDEGEKVKVGLLTGVAGLGDKSFNDLAYDGAKQAEKELNIELKVVEPIDLASTEGLLEI